MPQMQPSVTPPPSTANVSPAAGITRITSQFSSSSQHKSRFLSHSKAPPPLPHNFLHSRCVKNSSFFIASIRQPQRNVLPAAAQRKLTCNFAAATARTAPFIHIHSPATAKHPSPRNRNCRANFAAATANTVLRTPRSIRCKCLSLRTRNKNRRAVFSAAIVRNSPLSFPQQNTSPPPAASK